MNETNRPSESDTADKELELIEAARKLNASVDTGVDSAATDREEQTLKIAALEHIAALELSPGTQIGPYKLLEKIGHGGFGVVYAAEQKEPIRRKVAVKIIKPGMDTREVIARFEAERQALALMDHPNIARVLDAGTTQTKHPYFVMALVRGVPITQYCDQRKLGVRERLELFVSICHAVQHAHQKGIIHRDIKPSNVLVELDEDRAVPKIIDFGVAKATSQQLTEHTVHTFQAQMIGTPLYMSPEQAQKSGLDVDTRTDIYSLGVLLYELLTGTTPIDKQRLSQASPAELIDMVCEEEPTKPSTQIDLSSDAANSIAATRGTDPVKLHRQLEGDLDWIVIKALEKDRTRRYETANGFANDIRRDLNDDPVTARPPSTVYRINKFVRKNRGLVVTGACVLALLIAGITGTTIGLYRAKAQAEQARRAETVAKAAAENALRAESEARQSYKRYSDVLQIVARWFKFSRPEEGSDAEMTAKDVLFKAHVSLKDSDMDDLGRAALLEVLAISFLEVGEYDAAISIAEESLEVRKAHLGEDHPETLSSMNSLALGYRQAGRLPEAIERFERTLELRRTNLGEDHPDTLMSMNDLAVGYYAAGRLPEAIDLFEKTLELRKTVLGEDHPETLKSMSNLAVGYNKTGRLPEAIQLAEKTLELKTAKLGEDHPSTLTSAGNLANDYRESGRLPEAIELDEKTLELRKTKLGEDHPETLKSMQGLANNYRDAGRLDEAIALDEETLELRKAELGEDHPDTLMSMNNLAIGYRDAGRLVEAIKLLKKTLELGIAKLGEDHFESSRSMSNLADTLRICDQQLTEHLSAFEFEQAEQLLHAMEQHHGPHTALVRDLPRNLHLVHLGQRKYSDALNSIDRWLLQLDQNKTSERQQIAWATTSRAVCYLELGTFAEAEKTANQAVAIAEIAPIQRQRCNGVLAVCLAHRQEFEEAERKATEACKELEAMLEVAPPHLRWYVPRAAGRVIKVYQMAEKPEMVNAWKSKLTEIESQIKDLNASEVSASQADTINQNVWDKVAKPFSGANSRLTTKELDEMRRVCRQFPTGMYLNTLGVAEYRMGNFKEAIAAAEQSLEKHPQKMNPSSPHPSDLAILAMSHHQLGNTDKADEYRQRLADAMKLDAFQTDGEAQSFAGEATELFDLNDTSATGDGN